MGEFLVDLWFSQSGLMHFVRYSWNKIREELFFNPRRVILLGDLSFSDPTPHDNHRMKAGIFFFSDKRFEFQNEVLNASTNLLY